MSPDSKIHFKEDMINPKFSKTLLSKTPGPGPVMKTMSIQQALKLHMGEVEFDKNGQIKYKQEKTKYTTVKNPNDLSIKQNRFKKA